MKKEFKVCSHCERIQNPEKYGKTPKYKPGMRRVESVEKRWNEDTQRFEMQTVIKDYKPAEAMAKYKSSDFALTNLIAIGAESMLHHVTLNDNDMNIVDTVVGKLDYSILEK